MDTIEPNLGWKFSFAPNISNSSTFSPKQKRGWRYLQQASLILGRFAFYDMIWGYFDCIKLPFRIFLHPWISGSKQICFGSFNWSTISLFWSRGKKVANPQSWRSWKKNLKNPTTYIWTRFYVMNCCSPGGPGSIHGRCKFLGPITLHPSGQQECKVPHLRIYIRVKKEKQPGGTFNSHYAQLIYT